MTVPSRTVGRYVVDRAQNWNMISAAVFVTFVIWVVCSNVAVLLVSATYSLPPYQRNILLEFYNATIGPEWTTPWPVNNPQSNPCSWYGVYCSSSCQLTPCYVEKLVLIGNGLGGSLPASLGSLSTLTSLTISFTNVGGQIPPSLGQLGQLQELYLLSDSFTGPLPSSLGNCVQLTSLDVTGNHLTGTLPPSYGNFTQLVMLAASANHIHGSIPPSYGRFSQLEEIYLDKNLLTGNVPELFGVSPKLEVVYLSQNFLTGPMIASFGNKLLLTDLYLIQNQFTGTIPLSYTNLSILEYLYLSVNYLNGTVPNSIGNLTTVNILQLYSNMLSGNIPSSINSLSSIQSLDWSLNVLTGKLPINLFQLSTLMICEMAENYLSGSLYGLFIAGRQSKVSRVNYLDLSFNQLTGHIPPAIANLSILTTVYLNDNLLSGTIPSTIGTMNGLIYFSVFSNRLSGTISNSFGNISNLDALYLFNNEFTGSIPAVLLNSAMQSLYVFSNFLTGTLPAPGSVSSDLKVLNVYSNLITGTIPSQFTRFFGLRYIDLSDCLLSGSISSVFSTQISLQSVFVSNNMFTGMLDNVFKASYYPDLSLDVSYNMFTGSLPIHMINSRTALALIATVNCLSGTIPTSLCQNPNISDLVLGGLHAAHSCDTKFTNYPRWIPFKSAYEQSNAVHGTIPECIFSLPKVEYLSLSGNGLTGTLASSLYIVPSMQFLDLSHNSLSGSIPTAMLQHNFTDLDLSFNRFSGTIPAVVSEAYATNNASSLNLEVNLLSGALPSGWVYAQDIQVLSGNMFACNMGLGSTINAPVNDPSAQNYQCGSQTTNFALLAFTAVAALLSGVLMLTYLLNKEAWKPKWKAVEDFVSSMPYRPTAQLIVVIFFTYILLSIVLYSTLSVTYGTYSEKYVWVIALASQEGIVAAVLLFLWLILLESVVLYGTKRLNPLKDEVDSSFSGNKEGLWSNVVKSWKKKVSIIGSVKENSNSVLLVGSAIAHAMIIFVVNALYVYSTAQNLSRVQHTSVMLGMVFFKLVWGSLFAQLFFTGSYDLAAFSTFRPVLSWMDFLFVSLNILNFVLAPLVTELLVSPNCFKYAINPPQSTAFPSPPSACYFFYEEFNPNPSFVCSTNSATIELSSNATDAITIVAVVSTNINSLISFTPGFAYNFRCSLSLLQAFASVFIYRCLFLIVIEPFLWIVLKYLHHECVCNYGSTSIITRWFSMPVPPLLTPLGADCRIPSEERRLANVIIMQKIVNVSAHRTMVQLRLRVLTELAIMLSFGVLFPPLAFLEMLTIVMDALKTVSMIRRLRGLYDCTEVDPEITENVSSGGAESFVGMKESTNDQQAPSEPQAYNRLLDRCVASLEAGLSHIPMAVGSRLPLVLVAACWIWAFALYDILGFQVGAIQALWILVITAASPLWLGSLIEIARYRWSSGSKKQTVSVELQPTHNPLSQRSSIAITEPLGNLVEDTKRY